MIRSWSYDRSAVSRETGLACVGPSLTVQSQRDEADINNIVRMFGVTGQLPASVRLPSYGDFTGISDFRSALEAVREAEEAFLAIPSNVRAEFSNSPQAFLEFCSDPSSLPKLREWGLAPTPEGTARSDSAPT